MRSRLTGTVLALACAAGSFLATATPAYADAPRVRITKVWYDSPGPDNGSNRSLNGEYIRITNRGGHAVGLGHWSLRDGARHVYRFDEDVVLDAGASVTVHTGRGTDSRTRLYWGHSRYVWNNTGDTATLRDAHGSEWNAPSVS